MDRETGEPFREPETGEMSYPTCINDETGEPESYYPDVLFKRPFKIPKCYIQCEKPQKPLKTSEKRVEFITAIVFLIPSTVLFSPILAMHLIFCELVLHIWCHKINDKRKDTSRYYQSPLHVISKEFCSDCRRDIENVKINKIQAIRHDRYDRFKKYGLDSLRAVT